MATVLREQYGIFSAPRYIQKPAFQCQIFRDKVTFGKSQFPFTHARPEACEYDDADFQGTLDGLESILVLPWNEGYKAEHVEFIATAIRNSVEAIQST